ncbi:hypothetical protein [Methanolobus vulcani]|uniref:Uncharacterized protein n=1 Tax=Methanolobus vulcani TaxID=38026 RepID=A0A7Z8P143_9EURY|nr:hypothetical protein [Methanolobus vulcani]TQD23544.1 hypothetical protein FKV42_13555 [Methanolobus vulcani]
MSKTLGCAICLIIIILCTGCIEDKQAQVIDGDECTDTRNPLTEEDIALIDNFAESLNDAEEIASYVEKMEVIDFYSRPNAGYIFPEEVFYMSEDELDDLEDTESLIHFNRTPIHFVGLNNIEEFGDVEYGRSHLNALISSAFTPMYGVEDEQLNCIIFSRNILFNHCLSEEHKERLKSALKVVDTWGQFRESMLHANVPINGSDANRTFAIDNVENVNVIMKTEWKQDDLKQYFEFLDSSGFNSSEDLLSFSRQFTVAKKGIDDDMSESAQVKILDARVYVVTNFPQYSDEGIQKDDMRAYLILHDYKG